MSHVQQPARDSGEASVRDPLKRFSSRVTEYVRARPGYPDQLFDFLQQNVGLTKESVVADIGSGTGIFTAPLLDRAAFVNAVEPNREMRQAAENRFAGHASYRSLDGTAEATGLPDHSVDLVTAAQAFHWFDPRRARAECLRILKPRGQVALVWNSRRIAGTPFLDDYESLLLKFGTDYDRIKRQHDEKVDRNAEFFQTGFQNQKFSNFQYLDFAGLKSRLLSSSYVPQADSPQAPEMLRELRQIFDRHVQNGTVTVEYDLELFYGGL